MNKKFLIFILIILLGAFLRFYNLALVPPSASVDEASTGYNAYSILKTGTDEYGTKFPIALRAYDDWQPALYTYIVIPFVKIFGLNVLSVRIPGATLSVVTLIASYYLVRELFKRNKNPEIIALFTTLFLAISPWHIYISRIGFPTNIGLTTLVLAILFLLRQKFITSTIFFVLSFMSYHSEKIFIPILLLGIFLIFRKEFMRGKKKIIIAFLFAFILLIPFLKTSFSPTALLRFKATNIYTINEAFFREKTDYLTQIFGGNDLTTKIFYNRRVLAAQMITGGYLSHFNPVWLFTNLSDDKHKIPGLGLLYVWEFPLVLIGIYILISQKFDSKRRYLIFLWFLAAPIAASITTDAPHVLRTHVFLPTWQIFSALGLYSIFLSVKNKYLQKIMFIFFITVLIGTLYYLQLQYFFVFPKTQSASFQYAISKAIPFVLEKEKSYDKIVFSNQGNLYQSYMFFLFYSRYDSSLYQKQGGTKSGGFQEEHKFGKYEFRSIDWKKDSQNKNTLFIGNFPDFPKAKILKTINLLDGKPAIKIVER